MKILYYIPKNFDKSHYSFKFTYGLSDEIKYKIATNIRSYIAARIKNPRYYNIVRVYDPPKIILRLEFFLKKISGSRIICHFTGTQSMEDFYDLPQRLRNLPSLFLFPHTELLKIFRKNIKAQGKTELMPNGIDENLFRPHLLKQLSFKKELLCYGDFHTGSKSYSVIESMKYLPSEYFLTCMGKVYEPEYLHQIQDLIRNLNLEKKIEIIIDFDDKLFKDKCRESNLFITVSKEFDEVFRAHEAIMEGTVVLYNSKDYRIKGLYEIESLAPKSIARQIKEICDSDSEVDVSLASSFFNWKSRIRELESFYRSV